MLKSNILKPLRAIQRPLTVSMRLGSSGSSTEKYTEKQEKLGRPVSPHVGIYKFPPAALSSITNRVTGVALSVGFFGAAVASLGGVDVGVGMSLIGDSCVGNLAKFSVAFPLVYHYLGGIRHMLWDRSPDMLTNEQVTQSSYVLIGTASAISVGLAFVSL